MRRQEAIEYLGEDQEAIGRREGPCFIFHGLSPLKFSKWISLQLLSPVPLTLVLALLVPQMVWTRVENI